MTYVAKLMSPGEEIVGIARLHWIYVLKGIASFVGIAVLGWIFQGLMGHAILIMASSLHSQFLPNLLMKLNNYLLLFMLGAGALIFIQQVVKVMSTEIGLTTRRIIFKAGLLIVNVREIDIEEVRGETLNLGWFGRVLGYGYIFLDCRFIGDVYLPAMDHPDRFLRFLNKVRAEGQDALSVTVGKGNAKPLKIENPPDEEDEPSQPDEKKMNAQQHTSQQTQQKPPTPDIQPGQPAAPQPEIQPGQQPGREAPMQPTPHEPPPAPSTPQPAPPQAPPEQPAPAPIDPQPPLQPPPATAQTAPAIDPAILAEAIKQAIPAVKEEVMREIAEQEKAQHKDAAPQAAPASEDHLLSDFDHASAEKTKAVDGSGDKPPRVVH